MNKDEKCTVNNIQIPHDNIEIYQKIEKNIAYTNGYIIKILRTFWFSMMDQLYTLVEYGKTTFIIKQNKGYSS